MGHAYVQTEIQHLFDSVDGGIHDTLNFRILWQDSILTRDHKVMQHVLATGFQEFEKGALVKLK